MDQSLDFVAETKDFRGNENRREGVFRGKNLTSPSRHKLSHQRKTQLSACSALWVDLEPVIKMGDRREKGRMLGF